MARSDAELLEAVIARDGSAWRELLDRFGALIRTAIARTAAGRGRPAAPEDIDDAFGDFCVALLSRDMYRLRAYDGRCKLGSWLYYLAGNTAVDAHRRALSSRRRDEAAELDEERPPPETPLETLLEREEVRLANSLIAQLRGRRRQFIELFFVRGLSPAEVAEEMGISPKTFYSLSWKLRDQLGALGRQTLH